MDVHCKTKQLAVLTMSLVVLTAGGFVVTRMLRPLAVMADSNRVFELRIYHAVPGKLPVMQSRFRDQTSKIPARHNLNVVGYWTTEDAKDNSFVFLFAHASRKEADKNWEAFLHDPEFQEVIKSEETEKTLEKADILWLLPTDFSPMR
jgi:hypothetical protein